MPWRQHHVVALRYGGGLSLANRRRSPFSLGGFPEPDLLSVLLTGSSFGGVALRGFAPGVTNGNRFHLVQAEYRFPLFDANRGIATLPLYLGRLHAVAFGDLGVAYRDRPDWDELRGSMGVELHAQLIAGYYLPLMLRAGFAYGMGRGGGPQFYLNLGRGF